MLGLISRQFCFFNLLLMEVFWKHFSLTTLENRWMWYTRPQKVLEQFLINIVAVILFYHIVSRFVLTLTDLAVEFYFCQVSRNVLLSHLKKWKKFMKWYQKDSVQEPFKFRYKIGKKVSKFPAWLYECKALYNMY